MEKLQNKVHNFLKSHNYNISDKNLSLLTNKLYKLNLFDNYEKQFQFVQQYQNGGATLPSEYFGVDSGSYIDSNAGTDTSSTNDAIRPELTSEIFPMNGGGCPACMVGGMFKGCTFFTNNDMKDLKRNKFLNFNNKELKDNKDFLNNKLNVYLHKLMNSVKNKQNLIGKSHINLV